MLKSALLLFVAPFALADIRFTEAELHQHQLMVPKIVKSAAACLDGIYEDQVAFHNQWHISKYYGNRRSDYASRPGRIRAIMNRGYTYTQAEQIAALQVPTACITMTLNCLGKGFTDAGMKATWNKIYAELAVDNKFYGTDLQKILRQLGWRSLYWNPDPASSAGWDREDRQLNPLKPGKKWNPVWGGHADRYREVQSRGSYYGIPIDDATTLVGFRETPPQAFSRAPFFVGTAHSGYHVFPGRAGEVIEAHSTREIDSIDNIQFSRFNPLADGGGPRWTPRERYRSGVIVIPPEF